MGESTCEKLAGLIFNALMPDFKIEGLLDAGGNPRVILRLIGSRGEKSIRFVVDTGFTGSLAISPDDIDELGLEQVGVGIQSDVDGQVQRVPVYGGAVLLWAGRLESVVVFPASGDPLLGMDLLEHALIEFQGKGQTFRISI